MKLRWNVSEFQKWTEVEWRGLEEKGEPRGQWIDGVRSIISKDLPDVDAKDKEKCGGGQNFFGMKDT